MLALLNRYGVEPFGGALSQVISAYDCHWPFTHKPTLKCLLEFTEHIKPATFLFGGDQLDLACISHHTKGKPLYRTKAAYLGDVEGFDKHVLTPIEKCLPKKSERVWIIGNHEFWESQLGEESPELINLVNHQRLLRLKERGWKVIPLGKGHRIGKLTYLHGEWLTGFGNQGPAMPSKKLVEVYASNAVAGHTHSPQSFSRVSPVDQNSRWCGWVSPCMCNLNPGYTRNRPKSWVLGWNITEFAPDGSFNHFPLICTRGRVMYGGVTFGG